MRKKMMLLFLLVLFPLRVTAECSDEEVIRLQKLANNINVNYEYDEDNNKFMINFTNLTGELNITDNNSYINNYEPEYSLYDVSSGNHKYYVYASDKNCYESELTIKSIQIPYYNPYYEYKECKGIEEYEFCSKWLSNNISYDLWKKNVTKYREQIKKENINNNLKIKKTINDKIKNLIVDLYVTHYNIFLPIVILALCAIIYLKNKSDQLI